MVLAGSANMFQRWQGNWTRDQRVTVAQLVGVIISPGQTDTRFYFQSGLALVANFIFRAN